MGGNQIGRNSDQLRLGLVGIGDETPLDYGRGAGDLGEQDSAIAILRPLWR
jgi:hypothetical protein